MDLTERNAAAIGQALDRQNGQFSSYEARLRTMENHITMLYTQIKQLQDLFATRTVARDSGATTE